MTTRGGVQSPGAGRQKLMRLLPDGYPEQGYKSWTDGPVRYARYGAETGDGLPLGWHGR